MERAVMQWDSFLLGQYGGGFDELEMLLRAFAGSQFIYLQIALMASLFVVLIFRPERIRVPRAMMWSYILLSASFVAPFFVEVVLELLLSVDFVSFMAGFEPNRSSRAGFMAGGSSGMASWIVRLPTMITLLMLAMSVSLAFYSLLVVPPRAATSNRQPKPPQQHPLD